MIAKNLLADILALPVVERLELFEQLRENLRNEPALSPLSEEDKRLLDERLADLDADPAAGSSWDEVEARVLRSLGDRA